MLAEPFPIETRIETFHLCKRTCLRRTSGGTWSITTLMKTKKKKPFDTVFLCYLHLIAFYLTAWHETHAGVGSKM